jgi:hypothetical protein
MLLRQRHRKERGREKQNKEKGIEKGKTGKYQQVREEQGRNDAIRYV